MTGPDSVWAIRGQARAADVLRRAAASGEIGHAWAFLGPAGVGQERAARALVASLTCAAAEPPCGACDPCVRALAGSHPAYTKLDPSGAVHRVDDVRERWLPVAHRSAGEGGWKVLRVVEADRMNDAAANAFLKGLEEPPPQTVWLLDIEDPDDLPATILSRCRAVRFTPLDSASLDEEARQLGLADETDRALAVRVSFGSPERLAKLAEPGKLDAVRAHRQIPRRLRKDRGEPLVAAYAIEQEASAWAKDVEHDAKAKRVALEAAHGDSAPRSLVRELEERETRAAREARTAAVAAALDDLAAWYRDVLLVQAGGDPADAVHAEDPDGLAEDAAALSASVVLSALDTILDTRAALERNASSRLALEACFMDLTARSLTG